ncbi:MAG: hypothetical protein ACE5FY_06495 [Nitrospiria bacterium]
MNVKNKFKKNLLVIPPEGLELNFTYHYYLGGRIATKIEPSVFEQDNFIQDPLSVKSALPFCADDIVLPLKLWDKIQLGNDPLSQYLRRQFSASIRKQLTLRKDSDSSLLFLKTILSNKLNQFLVSNRFRSAKDYEANTTTASINQKPKWIDLVSLNRSLLTQTYEGLLSKGDETQERYRVTFRNLRSAQATAYFSDQFLGELILTQFQINVENETKANDKFTIHLQEDNTHFASCPFTLSQKYETFEGISSIEVTVWKYGFVSLNIRLQNMRTISANHLLDAICHPELIRRRSESHGQKIGDLLIRAEFFRNKIDRVIVHALKELDLMRLTFESGKWEALPEYGRKERLTCSRPYIGTIIFKTETAHNDLEDEKKELMKKHLVVSTGRTTPAFLSKYDDVDNYLSQRNIYGASGSIVYIARRGWCVLDSDERDKMAFRLGVVEAVHIVINIINTAARAQRLFTRAIHHEGAFVFEQLNIKVKQMVSYPYSTMSWRAQILSWIRKEENGHHSLKELRREQKTLKLKKHEAEEEFSKWIAEATSFMARARLVSPFGDLTELLEAHLIANTSRNAVRRCKYLTGLDNLRSISQEMMKNYTAFLRTSSNYLNLVAAQNTERTRKSTQVRMWLAVFGVLVGLLGWFFSRR